MKRFLSKLLLCIFILTSSTGLYAQQNIQFNDLKQTLQPGPHIKIGKLPNGLTYYIKENKKPEKRMEILLAVKAGAVLEDDDQNGLAHFCEHMAFNGTKHYPKMDLVNFLESIGVKFGADLNAFTSYDQTVYMLQLPTDKEDLLEKGLLVLDDWSHNVSFDDTEIDKERGVILEEWRLGKGAEDRVQKKHDKVIYYNSRYVERDVIGDTAIIEHFAHPVIRRFYHDWYRPDLMAVIAVGDFDKNEIEKKIIAHFSDLTNPENERPRTEYTIPPHKQTLVSIATDKELTFPNVRIYFKHQDREKSSLGSYRQDIVDNLFTTMINNRFGELRRKTNPPFIFAMANEGRFIDHIRAFMLMGGAKGDGINQCTEALLTEAFRVMQHGFTKTEFDRAKKDAMRNMEKAYDERNKTESRNYAFEFMRNFLDSESIPGIETELEIYKKLLPEITLDEVNKLSPKLITKENTVITVSAPEHKGIVPPTESEVLAMYDEISKKNIPAYEDVVITKPLVSQKPFAGKIIKENKVNDIGVTEWTLSNGVKVILKPTDFKNDEILFTSYNLGGTSLAKDDNFISATVAASIINQSGVGDFDENQLEKYLAGKEVQVYPSIDELTEKINGSGSPKDLEVMFQLIYMYITNPRKDNDAYQSFINKAKASLKDSKNSPRSVFGDTISSVASNYHFRGRPFTESMINEMHFDKAYEFYKDRFSNADGFTFIFVGNFDLDKIKPYILTYIGGLPSNNKKETWKDVNIKIPTGKISKEVKKGIEAQSFVRLIFSGKFDWTFQNRYDLNSLIDVLNIKLREVLREDKGGVYGVGVWASPKHYPRDDYRIDITFGCSPDRVDELIGAALQQIDSLKIKKPDDTYINKVKETQIREREVNLKENRFWLNSLNSYFFNNEDPSFILQYSKFFDKLNADDIQKSAQKYFNEDNLIKVVLYPENK